MSPSPVKLKQGIKASSSPLKSKQGMRVSSNDSFHRSANQATFNSDGKKTPQLHKSQNTTSGSARTPHATKQNNNTQSPAIFFHRIKRESLARWTAFSARIVKHRLFRYGVLLLLGFTLIWIPALTYVFQSEDVYKSKWSIIIPGSGVGSSLNIDSIGQTTTSVASPYTSSSVDPKVNYKAIILSDNVIRAAADSVGMTKKDYGKPLVKLIDQTAIMEITIDDNTSDASHNKSVALYRSFERELERLRNNERAMIDISNTNQLEIYKQQVSDAQAKLLDFQTSSISAPSNTLELSLASIDRLNNRRAELKLLIAAKAARELAIEQFTGLSTEQSTNVVKLGQDIILRELQLNYSSLYSEYLDRSSTLGARNPKVMSIASKLNALADAIAARATQILGEVDEEFIRIFATIETAGETNFYQEQIAINSDLTSDAHELAQLDDLVVKLEEDMIDITKTTALLEELTRAYKVAETIYLSTLAKQDLGKSDVFASYPMIQLLVPPRQPIEPEKLHRIFAIVGAIVGSTFVLLALVILWKRNALLQKLSKKR